MRKVTTAYHSANKAETRSSEFLVISDTGFGLNKISSSENWSFKSRTGLNSDDLTMWRCNRITSETETDYGHVIIGSYREDKYYSNAAPGNNITFLFENDCYPVEYKIEFFNVDSDMHNPASTVTGKTNQEALLTFSWFELLTSAGGESNLQLLKFHFTKWSKQGVKPVILLATYGEPAVFTKEDLLSVDITLETDPTCQTIPYNSYSCTVIDETDAYNPLIQDSKTYNFAHNQKFKFFNFEKGFADNDIITDELSLFDYEICPVGSAYFRNAKQQGTAVSFDFIDIVEKYDNIFLSDEELKLSSHFTKRNVKSYLTTLFGNDLDVSEIPSDLKSITPFYTESKTKILLYMAQIMQKYIYVTTEGILSFKGTSDSTENFCIELTQSYQNPVIEKNYENDGIEVSSYGYDVSQNPDTAFNRIEFIFDGEVKAFSDGRSIFDSETQEQIFKIPKHNFRTFELRYKLNDIYDRDSLFVLPFNGPVRYMADLIEEITSDIPEIKLSDGRKFVVLFLLEYYDTFITYTVDFGKNTTIKSTDSCYDEIVSNCAAFVLVMNNLQGNKITSTTNIIKKQKYNSNQQNTSVQINNPAVTDFETAVAVRDWISSQVDNSAFAIDTDWRGDCSLEIGDKIPIEVALTRNGIKSYENKYTGTVVKNIIEYNGALKMQTTLFAPVQDILS